ncbi:Williams-Beuren syndrome chromosomal region 16 protein [Danaus plexippus plexippus]|uniref:Williams-Beuren syndrome chromosomal region 16 protein n=1 Tax=Danaus plexippus plexippus TaxID=278856 RepID=A0A212ENZ3_DANPL|nr:Williams-Beuren syndrome chromosomal region 16 protein [Danaus plexippus plexippus]
MNAIKLFVQRRSFPLIFNRTATTKKKIHDPSEEDRLPIFQYPISKSSDRRVYVWGLAETGALGIHMPRGKKKGKKAYRNNFSYAWHPIRSSFCERFDVTNIACGYGFTVAAVKTKEQHKVFGTGINTDSQIGYHAPRMGHPLEMLVSPAPIFIPYASLETKITGLAAGRAHTVILTDNEGVFTLGNNAYGQCGRKINPQEEYKGSMVSHNIKHLGKENIKSVCCGQDHSLFITESGKVYACGWGADGQTGLGIYENQGFPARVKGDITSENIVKVASTADCVLALSDRGELFGWGNSEYGQVPMNTKQQQVNMSYALLNFTKGLGKIVDIAAGGSFCLICNDQGDVFVWGFGLLGLGPNVQHTNKPTQIPAPLFGRNEFNPECMVTKVACGIGHLAAITNSGDLYVWGRNRYGCLGLGHQNDQHFPLKIGIGAHVLSVNCSVDHTVAVCKPFT